MSGVNHHESAALRKAIDSSYELSDDDRQALSPEHHQPVWMGLRKPPGWICAVCWTEYEVTSWPCEVAQEHGKEIAEAGGLRHAS